jgi:hypothetical protein
MGSPNASLPVLDRFDRAFPQNCINYRPETDDPDAACSNLQFEGREELRGCLFCRNFHDSGVVAQEAHTV